MFYRWAKSKARKGPTQNSEISGITNPLKVGDVQYIPAGITHGVSEVNGKITWLNVRWDADWPPDAPMGAGNASPSQVAADSRDPRPLEYAPTDHSIYVPKEKLDAYRNDMDAKGLALLRMIEGSHFNVNIRRIKEPSSEFHNTTIDTWVILEGNGTASTGFRTDQGDQFAGIGKLIEGTGINVPTKAGDVFFIPAHLTHGFSSVSGVVAWLNIRWDANYTRN